jgi:hypothetical protein
VTIGALAAAVLGATAVADVLTMILAPPSRAEFAQRRG